MVDGGAPSRFERAAARLRELESRLVRAEASIGHLRAMADQVRKTDWDLHELSAVAGDLAVALELAADALDSVLEVLAPDSSA